jgi:hypothetical protein
VFRAGTSEAIRPASPLVTKLRVYPKADNPPHPCFSKARALRKRLELFADGFDGGRLSNRGFVVQLLRARRSPSPRAVRPLSQARRKAFYLLTMLSFDAERPTDVAGCNGSVLSSG